MTEGPGLVAAGDIAGDVPGADLPTVVLAGRPNVGKSTLVNRLVGRRVAVVEERPGVTRDRLELVAAWRGQAFRVVDTGGWLAGGDVLEEKVARQAVQAMKAADLVLVVTDVVVGPTEEDVAVAKLVRRVARRHMLVGNKADNEARGRDAWSLVSLGLGDPVPVSALHGTGTGDLLDLVVDALFDRPARSGGGNASGEDALEQAGTLEQVGVGEATGPEGGVIACPQVAVVGRPNVGKSTLFNRLVGEDRTIVHDMPGTTRDAIDTLVELADGPIRFIDTAGLRRRSGIEDGAGYYAVVRALQALDRADVSILVVDATEGVTHQDQRLAERIGAAGSPVVVVLNKWDVLDPERRPRVLADAADRLGFLGEAPTLKVSARTGLGAHKVVPALRAAIEAYHRRVPTGELNRALRAIQQAHPAPGSRIRYAVQGGVDPPTFTLFATRRLPATYLRYLERSLRERFDLGATPLSIRVRLGGR